MMKVCQTCGGAVGEPGRAYGFAGTWCSCSKPKPDAYPPVSGFPEIRPTPHLDEYIRELQQNPPKPPAVAPSRFVDWLRGYFAAGGPHAFTQGDWKRIAEELAKVSP